MIVSLDVGLRRHHSFKLFVNVKALLVWLDLGRIVKTINKFNLCFLFDLVYLFRQCFSFLGMTSVFVEGVKINTVILLIIMRFGRLEDIDDA